MMNIDVSKINFGYLRESQKKADLEDAKKGKDPFGFPRTGMDVYLKIIFPETDIEKDRHLNKSSGILYKNGLKMSEAYPDYRYDDGKRKIVIEFDGTGHYKYPDKISQDLAKDNAYEAAGYEVVRISYFIQLTNKVVKQMFGIDVKEKLFSEGIGSMTYKLHNIPKDLCEEGVKRMAKDFLQYPEQYEYNVKHLLEEEQQGHQTGVSFLVEMYDQLRK